MPASRAPAPPPLSRRPGSRSPLPDEGHEGVGSPARRPAGRPREVDLPRRLEPFDACGGERASRKLGLDRGARDERDAVTGLDSALDRFLEAEGQPDIEI